MKSEKQAVDMFLAGAPVLIVTYHSYKAEVINYRDKVTKQAASFPSLKHTCLTDMGAVVVQERVTDEGFKPEAYQTPYKRNDRLLLTVTAMSTNQGVTVISGTLEGISAPGVGK